MTKEPSIDAIELAGHVFSKRDLIWRTMRNMKGASRWGSPRWVLVKESFGVGSTVARSLCFEFGLNPDDELRKGRATIFDGAKESVAA